MGCSGGDIQQKGEIQVQTFWEAWAAGKDHSAPFTKVIIEFLQIDKVGKGKWKCVKL